jgi:phosphate transport system protein
MRNSPLDEAIDAAATTGSATRDPELVADRHPFREAFDRELGAVKEGVLRMGSLVEEQILAALRSLVDHDADRALTVMAADGRINEVQRDVSAQIVMTIATQQPVARDLRFLLALDHVTAELERMGDHAGSVAKQARKLAPFAPIGGYRKLERMAELAAELVHGVLLSLVDVDEARAREVAARDDEIDTLYHALFDEVLDAMRSNPANVNPGARVLFAAHYLERIGDRVTNIAEDVVFLATGEIEDLNP